LTLLWFGDSIPVVVAKLEQLKSLLRGYGRTLVAYSGSVNSELLEKY
jgi:PP-loop superfamily ATP-utilizing enzyme